MRVRTFVSIISLSFLAAGCGLGKLEVLRKFEPRGTQFQKALAKEYREFAESQEQNRDLIDAQYFADKGLRAAKGQDVPPDQVDNWSIDDDIEPSMQQARMYLTEVLVKDMTGRYPDDTARAQLLFDCWLEQQEKANEDQVPPCREEFFETLDTLYTKRMNLPNGAGARHVADGNGMNGAYVPGMYTEGNDGSNGAAGSHVDTASASHGSNGVGGEDEYIATGTSSASVQPDVIENPNLTFTVYFDFNSSTLTKSSEATLHDVLRKLKKMGKYELVISGHTDRSGKQTYNLPLSQKRAERVKERLVQLGADRNSLSVFGYGELYPKVKTADGVKNRANRRTHLVIRSKAK